MQNAQLKEPVLNANQVIILMTLLVLNVLKVVLHVIKMYKIFYIFRLVQDVKMDIILMKEFAPNVLTNVLNVMMVHNVLNVQLRVT